MTAATGGKAEVHIFVVDDDVFVLRALTRVLSSRTGIQVHPFQDGRAAIADLETRAEPIALAFLDLDMPQVDGVQCVHAIRAMSPTTAIVILTANPISPRATAARALGLHAFLTKPATKAELFAVIDSVSR